MHQIIILSDDGIPVGTETVPSLDIQRNFTQVPIPEIQFPRFNGDSWISDEHHYTESLRSVLKASVTAIRYEHEVGGIKMPDGSIIETDHVSQSKFAGAKVFSDLNPDALINWKAENGWTSLDRNTILFIASEVGQHVQRCFSNERRLHELIDTLPYDELLGLDVTDGWEE